MPNATQLWIWPSALRPDCFGQEILHYPPGRAIHPIIAKAVIGVDRQNPFPPATGATFQFQEKQDNVTHSVNGGPTNKRALHACGPLPLHLAVCAAYPSYRPRARPDGALAEGREPAPPCPPATADQHHDEERNRLLRFGRDLGAAIKDLITIRLTADIRPMGQRRDQVGRQEGQDRPATEQELRELNVTIARTMNAGYTRVMGELEKVGIKPPSRNTVKKILKAAGLGVCFRLGTSQIADSISPRVYMGS